MVGILIGILKKIKSVQRGYSDEAIGIKGANSKIFGSGNSALENLNQI